MRKLLVGLVVVLAACGGGGSKPSGSITVLAASSLTEAFTELGGAFTKANPGDEVTFSFAGSAALVEQANGGAPGDVIVTADQSSYDKVTGVGDATVIAKNRLAILVGKGNPKGITGLADLAKRDIVLVLCAPEVPCGRFGQTALDMAGVRVTPKSLEENVKGVVSKVTLGEADAGIVYVTDVKAATGKADGVDIDIASDADLEASYPMGVLDQSTHSDVAKAWIDFVASADGQAILASYGFLPPG
jgi:molybdate transport system substrate-binding protein